ncbi:hypothetical protein BH683_004010 [Williamsia sp. 1138]|uniref:hypothetical protein n=1 Tax=Williamsia sp. 1138 TaxID=1903117 RepID=UPI000A102EA7|nr:hypothetical protein [Williamsia sp. 1138]OZG30442.1 hypothetical protein BH683_004010 [Williamsia sp. 1138]
MTEPGRPPSRPRPGRPEIRIAPLREPVADERPRIVDAGAVVWLVALAALTIAAIWQAFNHVAVRAAISDSLAADHPATKRSDIDDTVTIIMVGNGVAALVILAVAVVGVIRVRDRISSGRTMLTVIGVLAAAVGIQFWLVAEPARNVVGPVISVLPLVLSAGALIGTALLYAPAVGTWLKAAPPRR